MKNTPAKMPTLPFVLYRNNQGLTCPSFQCDFCGGLITDAAGAMLVWEDYDKKPWSPRIACKIDRCDRQAIGSWLL